MTCGISLACITFAFHNECPSNQPGRLLPGPARHGHYDIRAFFQRDGIYGKIQAQSAIVYMIGIVIELLFVNQTYYTGPFVNGIGEVDISWVLGFVVPFAAYLAISKAIGRSRSPADSEAIPA